MEKLRNNGGNATPERIHTETIKLTRLITASWLSDTCLKCIISYIKCFLMLRSYWKNFLENPTIMQKTRYWEEEDNKDIRQYLTCY